MSVPASLILLRKGIQLEEEEQAERYRLDQQHSLKQLKAEGIALHPITVTRKRFGYAEYPEISFRLPFPQETSLFRDGMAIACFKQGEEEVKGMLMQLDGKAGEFRLYAPDHPEWIEDEGVGIKLAPDTRTTTIMKQALGRVESDKRLAALFQQFHEPGEKKATASSAPLEYFNQHLNTSQQEAVNAMLSGQPCTVVHGPPGTGKTTTLIEGIRQLVKSGKKVVVSAPSNTAVDHISLGLIAAGIRVLRTGNTGKVHKDVFPHTPEGIFSGGKVQKEIKALRIRAEEFRKMANRYVRSFGKAEREQRNLLIKEVKQLRTEIKKIQAYEEEKLFRDAQVICGTPIGLYDSIPTSIKPDMLVIDEAGQCLEPLAWCIFPLAETYILAGDHFQLPPTVLSQEAIALGYSRSILEVAIDAGEPSVLLDTQYRMRPSIAGFSSSYFYEGKLRAAAHLTDEGKHIHFIDTAGTGYAETHGPGGTSLQNEGELSVITHLLEHELADTQPVIISPYAGQVAALKDKFGQSHTIHTIDSYQGQESGVIIISLVRSNDEGIIGFLKDYRRMNVAMTRAKRELYIIGDSATLGNDPFYSTLLDYITNEGLYRSAWEFIEG